MQGFLRVHPWLPEDIRSRSEVVTADSAKGMEADHVFIVFIPRPQHKDLGGISADEQSGIIAKDLVYLSICGTGK